MSHLTRLTRSVAGERGPQDVDAARRDRADPGPVHRQSRRDRRPHSAHRRPPRHPGRRARASTAAAPSTCSTFGASWRAAPESRRRRPPSRVRLPVRERGLRRGGRGGRDPLGRAAAVGDPGDGRQGVGTPAGRRARYSDRARLRRRRPDRTRPCSRRRGRSRAPTGSARHAVIIKPAAGGGGKGMRVVDSLEPRGCVHRRARRCPARGGAGLRRRAPDPRALSRRPAPRRGPGPVRRPWQPASISASATARSSAATRRSSRRSPSPAVDEPLRATARRCGPRARGSSRLSLGRDLRVPARRRRPVPLPRDEHPAPGRASGHRADHRAGPGRRPAADRGRRGSSGSARRMPIERGDPAVTRSRCASTPRIPTPASCRRRSGSKRSSGRHPAGRGRGTVRIDSGIELGSVVDTHFDPMLAKLIVGGPNPGRGARRTSAPPSPRRSSSGS